MINRINISFPLLLLFFITAQPFLTVSLGQVNNQLKGHWEGYLRQKDGGIASDYYLGASIDSVVNDSIYGTSLIHIQDRPDLFGTFRMNGHISGNRVMLQDLDILKQNLPENAYWCIKTMQTNLTQTDSGLVIKGPWTAPNCDRPGTIMLFKRQESAPPDSLENTLVEVKEVLTVENGKIIIEIYDNDREEGDIISLNFNEDWIKRYVRVRKKASQLTLDLQSGTNTLIMYAENLGRFPPNTAAIRVHDGKKVHEIILNSDTGTSQAIQLQHDY